MALKWFNIRGRETRISETEPQTAALWSSSDRSPNITQGQDFGWRLAPEVVVKLKQIKQDYSSLEKIAVKYNVMLQDVDEKMILQFISDTTQLDDAPEATEGDYSDEYDREVRRLEAAEKAKSEPVPTTTTTTVAPTTTTTTTKPQTTTTTTIKVK